MAAYHHWPASREDSMSANAMGVHSSQSPSLAYTSAGPAAFLPGPACHPPCRPGLGAWSSPWDFSPPPSSLAVEDTRLLATDYFGPHPPAHTMYGGRSEYDSDTACHALSTVGKNASLVAASTGAPLSPAHHAGLQYPTNLTGLATPSEDAFGSGPNRESYVRTHLHHVESPRAWHAPPSIASEHAYSLARTVHYPPEPIECVPVSLAQALSAKRPGVPTKLSHDSATSKTQTKAGTKKKGSEPGNSHRAVEKRYRKNLNAKIAELQRCITAVDTLLDVARERKRSTSPCEMESDVDWGDDVKLQKGVILSNAAACIRNLHSRNVDLERQNRQLASKLAHF